MQFSKNMFWEEKIYGRKILYQFLIVSSNFIWNQCTIYGRNYLIQQYLYNWCQKMCISIWNCPSNFFGPDAWSMQILYVNIWLRKSILESMNCFILSNLLLEKKGTKLFPYFYYWWSVVIHTSFCSWHMIWDRKCLSQDMVPSTTFSWIHVYSIHINVCYHQIYFEQMYDLNVPSKLCTGGKGN